MFLHDCAGVLYLKRRVHDFSVKRRERTLARIIPVKREKEKEKRKEKENDSVGKKREKENNNSIVLQIALPATAIHQALESSGEKKGKKKKETKQTKKNK